MLAFAIDADNLCTPDSVDEAFRKLESELGPVDWRRAYGSADKLKGLNDVLKSRFVRPFLNMALSKNTTDVALAVDIMELSYQTPRPTIIAIGSGDADFVPLVIRLRERGIRVICISERGKMAVEAVHAYNDIWFVGNVANSATAFHMEDAAPVLAPPPAKKAAAKQAPAKKAPAKKVVAKKTPAKKTAAAPTPASSGKVEVKQILEAAPTLRSGDWVPLGDVAKALHDKKLLAKSATSTKLFSKFPSVFELTPLKQPNRVRYITHPA